MLLQIMLEENPIGKKSRKSKLKALEQVLKRNRTVYDIIKTIMLAVFDYRPQRKFSKKIQTFNQSLRSRANKGGNVGEEKQHAYKVQLEILHKC